MIRFALLGLFPLFLLGCKILKGNKEGQGPQQEYLTGYFIFFRDTIINKDVDKEIDKSSSTEFFIQDNKALDNLKDLNKLLENGSLDLLSSISGGSIQVNDVIKKGIDSMMSKEYEYLDYASYFPFDYHTIPTDTINSEFRFISVYRGKLAVYGAIKTVEPFTYNKSIDGYLYLKSSENNLQYLYSEVLPGTKFIGFLGDVERKMMQHNDTVNRRN